ncbi:MAG: formylglycine-generating enzyme family protein, partial [bacterium]
SNTLKTGTGAIMAAIATGLLWASGVRAGSLTPPGAPEPTMHTLEELYQKLTNTLADVQAAKQEVLVNQQRLADIEQRLVAAGSLQPASGDMVLIPAGSFVMGATTNAGHEAIGGAVPQHTVALSAFYMDKTEVTKAKWDEVYTWAMAKGYAFDNAGSGKASDHPVHTVYWYDALKWCNARSVKDGFTPCYTNANGTVYTSGDFVGGCNWSAGGYRLPTEAEWEKAARGGTAGRRFPWGDANTIQHVRANYNAAPASFSYDTSPTTTHHPSYRTGDTPYTSPAGSFAPNGYGLYDMAGNVFEWCWDWHNEEYYASSPGSAPTGSSSGTFRVLRGGSWNGDAARARCADRNSSNPKHGNYDVGFRCARGL